MKNLKTIVLGIFIISAIAINIFQPFKNNVAIACNPWDPNYNFLTGECDEPDPYTGEAAVPGDLCYITVYYPTGPEEEYAGYDEIDCTWTVAGECTPVSCEEQFGS